MPTQWFQSVDALSEGALTVRAQTVSMTDMGKLYWSGFAPRMDVDSVDLDDVTTLDDRPAADRREWNQRGRHVPPRTPARRKVSIVPIEAYDKIAEYEMQRLNERFMGNERQMLDIIGVSIPRRIQRLAEANYRRLELDFWNAWLNGQIVQRNPQNAAETFTASFGFSGSRLVTAGTAWDDPGVNAYDLLVAAVETAKTLIPGVAGVVTRLAVRQEIQADAPDLVGGVSMTRAQLEQRLQDDTGVPGFFIQEVEDTVDVYDDGGITTTPTNVFSAGRLAFIPADGRIGYTAFAPVVRAMELARQLPKAGIDTNGVTAFYDESGTGRELIMECQLNALPVPDEQRVYVVDTLIT